MKRLPCAGLAGLAVLAAHAQQPTLNLARQLDSVVATATRAQAPVSTLRDTVVITREELDQLGGLSLPEVLQLRAGIEYRATGGPGQPTGIFMRGAGASQTLVLVDGLRVGSATTGSTAVEAIPVELVERIEVVKGGMSSLYGSDAIGGVIHIHTRGKRVPHLFGSASYGSDEDARISAGLASTAGDTHMALNAGARRVNADSATNLRAPSFAYSADEDPHRNVFANLRVAQKLWTGETLTLEAFGSRSKTHFDGGAGASEHNEQLLWGARVSSSADFTRGWKSRLTIGHARDELRFFPLEARFETRQDQATWINEFPSAMGTTVLGIEGLRQQVGPQEDSFGTLYTRTTRETYSAFASSSAQGRGQHAEASIRYDDDQQFGGRTTGSASWGYDLRPGLRLALTLSRGFRAPTFNDLYLVIPGFYTGNPNLRPEETRGTEISLRGLTAAGLQWHVTAFETRLKDLIVFTGATVANVDRARVRGVEATARTAWAGLDWRAQLTLQRPEDEATGKRLQGRAEHFGSLEASRAFGPLNAAVAVVASGDRYDAVDEDPAARLSGYAVVDLRLRYRFPKHWSVELAATNVGDKRWETAKGYDAPGRGVLLTVRFDAF